MWLIKRSMGINHGSLGLYSRGRRDDAGSLAISGSSSNPSLVSNGNIVFGGSGANRTVAGDH